MQKPCIELIAMVTFGLEAAALLGGCAVAVAQAAIARMRLPDASQIIEEMNRSRGKLPMQEPAVSTDGVQVVFQTGHSSAIGAVALSPDGRYILSGGADETAKLWDVASRQEIRIIAGFDSLGPRLIAFTGDGTHAVIADIEHSSVYDLESGREVRKLTSLGEHAVVSADGRIAIQSVRKLGGGAQSIVDLASGQVVWTLPFGISGETAVALRGDGKTLLTRRIDMKKLVASSGRQVSAELRVWDVATHKLRAALPPSAGAVG